MFFFKKTKFAPNEVAGALAKLEGLKSNLKGTGLGEARSDAKATMKQEQVAKEIDGLETKLKATLDDYRGTHVILLPASILESRNQEQADQYQRKMALLALTGKQAETVDLSFLPPVSTATDPVVQFFERSSLIERLSGVDSLYGNAVSRIESANQFRVPEHTNNQVGLVDMFIGDLVDGWKDLKDAYDAYKQTGDVKEKARILGEIKDILYEKVLPSCFMVDKATGVNSESPASLNKVVLECAFLVEKEQQRIAPETLKM